MFSVCCLQPNSWYYNANFNFCLYNPELKVKLRLVQLSNEFEHRFKLHLCFIIRKMAFELRLNFNLRYNTGSKQLPPASPMNHISLIHPLCFKECYKKTEYNIYYLCNYQLLVTEINFKFR